MTLSEIFGSIEGHEFAARLGIASHRRQLLELLAQEPVYKELLDATKSNERAARAVLQRIGTLSLTEFDRDYQNPYDLALVGYVSALFETRDRYPLYLPLALDFASQAQDTWWFSRVLAAIQEAIPENKASHSMTTFGREKFRVQVGFVKAKIKYRVSEIARPGIIRNKVSESIHFDAGFGSRISKSSSVGTSMVH